MNKKILILLTVVLGTQSFLPFSRSLEEILKSAVDKRRLAIKGEGQDSDNDDESGWIEGDFTGKKNDQESLKEPDSSFSLSDKQKNGLRDFVNIGKDEMASRAKAIQNLFAGIKPRVDAKPKTSKKDKNNETTARIESDQGPKISSNLETEKTAPVIVLACKDRYKSQINRVLRLADQFVLDSKITNKIQEEIDKADETFLENLFFRFNYARFIIEILSSGCGWQDNKFLMDHGLTVEEKEKLKVQVLSELIDNKSVNVLEIVRNLLPKRFFVENNKFCVKILGLDEFRLHPDFVWWFKVIADKEFYKQNTYQVSRAFYLIDYCADLMALISKCMDTKLLESYKKELEQAISELRWLWMMANVKNSHGFLCESGQDCCCCCSEQFFMMMIMACIEQSQYLISV